MYRFKKWSNRENENITIKRRNNKRVKDTDTLYISNLGEALEIADDEQMQFVKDIEQTKNILVYHLIHRTTQYQDTTYYLFVDNNKKQWKAEKKDLAKQYTLALCYNKVKSFNEIGVWLNDGRITHIT